MILNGYIKIHRKLIQWGWYQDNAVKSVFLHLLIVAAFKPGYFMGIEIKPGQAIIGTQKLSSELGLSRQQVRTALKKLESTGEISQKTTNKFTVVTVANWADYQMFEEKSTNEQPTSNQQSTNEQPTDNQQITNHQPHLKNVKNVKNVEKVKKEIYGEYENVLLAIPEFEKLVSEYTDYQERIDNLSGYIASNGDKYKSHYATIRNWARRDIEKKATKQAVSFRDL